ncbi:MAG: 2-C-methyl-D-erythritol 4-phosphate cytidylyltransferase [marine benthic group bacterium]|nr:2-C-methyl-D-erythritol 4-phosphate cytidylyltransferase [Gemmatimonadota bacterium]
MRVAVVIVAAGTGSRFGGEPKQFRRLGGAPLLSWSCHTLARHPGVSDLIVVVPAEVEKRPPGWLVEVADEVVAGGETRRESVALGLAAVPDRSEFVLVHDGARPFVTPSLIGRVIDAGREGPAIPGLQITDTVKMIDDGSRVLATLDRDRLRTVQTPQAFPTSLLSELHLRAEQEATSATDDAALAERFGVPVRVIDGDPVNLKITTRADFALAEWLVAGGHTRRAGVEPPPPED